MFESRKQKVVSRRHYVRRQLLSLAIGSAALGIALGLGVAGYHWIAGQAWVDALLNASMILGGMGPVDPLNSQTAKLFAGCYALFSGVFFLVCVGVVIAPLLHRLLHYLHLESADQAEDNDPDEPNDGRRDRPHRPKKQNS